MRLIAAGFLGMAVLLHGGVISGIVLEQASGVPLARSKVRLDRVDATGRAQSESLIAGRAGQFTFSGVPDGLYVLTAARDGYASISFGQRRAQGSGPAFSVNKDTNLFAELRLRKLGVLTGRVLDENRLGIRRIGVSAFPVKPPFRSVGTAEADDRGVFRIHGLADGKYRLRSQAFRHDDGLAMLPTFAPEMLVPRDSRVYTTRLDSETTDIDVTPIAGTLISVGGAVRCPGGPVTVTLSTDTGRRETRAACNGNYQFDNLAPGNYEVFGLHADGRVAAFVERPISQTSLNMNLELRAMPAVDFWTSDETGRTPMKAQMALTVRRVDLAGVAETKSFTLDDRVTVTLAPGWWEASGRLASPLFLAGANLSFRPGEPRPSAHPDWFEFELRSESYASVSLRTSNKAGTIAGRVREGQKGVAAIPVFLWPVGANIRRRAGGPRIASANADGDFRFEGLPPGEYRLLASFDYDEVDDEIVAAANALALTVETSAVARPELTPYLAP